MPANKRKSPEPERDDEVTTPSNSPARKKLKITQHQKQTLIDNLQLEITERARGLRAQYALQAQDLRSRIERRINRIPVALRKTTMGALLDKYNTQSPKKSTIPAKATKSAATPTKLISREPHYPTINVAKSPSRRPKGTSIGGSYSDKENAPAPDAHIPLENPKKRGNPAASGQPRSVSQVLRDAESKVLSPKSSNSRTYKQSPLITSPTKASYMSRPTSPLKPSSPLKAMIEDARARTTRPDSRITSPTSVRRTKFGTPGTSTSTAQAKRTTTKSANPVPVKSPGRPATRQHERHMSTSTTSSNLSASTTIIKANRTAQRATATTSSSAAKRATLSRSQGPTAAANAKRAAATATKRAGKDATASTGRVLRKRV